MLKLHWKSLTPTFLRAFESFFLLFLLQLFFSSETKTPVFRMGVRGEWSWVTAQRGKSEVPKGQVRVQHKSDVEREEEREYHVLSLRPRLPRDSESHKAARIVGLKTPRCRSSAELRLGWIALSSNLAFFLTYLFESITSWGFLFYFSQSLRGF